MKLKDLLNGIDFTIIKGNIDIEINEMHYDSRNIKNNDVFFCIEGYKVDGHKFIDKAFEKGATVIICEKEVESLPEAVVVKVENSRKALAVASANYYENPARNLKLIGITGTNGKTTSTFMMKKILEEAGFKVGLIGTISNYIGDKKVPSHRTTPESLELHKLFKEMVDSGVQYCIMEVSSHSLYLNRVYGLQFSQAIFTNLTQDHLDFHKTFENYFNSKLILFKNTLNTIVNIDDIYGKEVFNLISENKTTYSIENPSDLQAKSIIMNSRGIKFNMEYKGKNIEINLGIPGRYNVYNALGSAAACINEGINLETIKVALEKVFVPGRCEIVSNNYNLGFEIIVDYAHSPDGLENILKTAREFTKGRLITVFGCGGDRDKTKRPIMGKIGSELSDIAVVTSDNPRTEEPNEIIKDILEGIRTDNYVVVENRKDAIKKAIQIAKKDDVIVIAGKGHEDYQELKDTVIHFDEREVIAEVMKELF